MSSLARQGSYEIKAIFTTDDAFYMIDIFFMGENKTKLDVCYALGLGQSQMTGRVSLLTLEFKIVDQKT